MRPTEKELAILKILWDRGPSTVRTVHNALGDGDQLAYTTSLKVLQIMHDKGLVSREKEGKTHLYKAQVSERRTQDQLVDKLMDTAFRGSATNMVLQLLDRGNYSEKELEEIRNYLGKLGK